MSIDLTHHAITRYQERVKPSLTWSAARRELMALVDGGGYGRIVKSLDWRDVQESAPHHIAFLVISDGVALALSARVCDRCEGIGHGTVAGRTVQCSKCDGKKTLTGYVGTTVIVRGGMNADRRKRKQERASQKRWKRRVSRHKPRRDGRPIPDADYEGYDQ